MNRNRNGLHSQPTQLIKNTFFSLPGVTACQQTGGGGLTDSTERVLQQRTDRPLKERGLGIGTGIYLTTAPSRESRATLAVKRDLLPAFGQTGLY